MDKEKRDYKQMEIWDEDSGNSAGSEDAGRGPVGSTKPNKKRGGPAESIEPDEEIEALFVPLKPQGLDPKDVNQMPKKQVYIKSEPGTDKSQLWDKDYRESFYIAAEMQSNYNTNYRNMIAWAGD